MIGDASADLDKDEQVSLLEAFIAAGKRTEEFYQSEGRLTTEHPLLEDNGDKRGVAANWFRGVRPVVKPRDDTAVDGVLAKSLHLSTSAIDRAEC